ncbi:MAG: site-2 protease family protein [Armatimonadota bacterium]
MIETIGGWANGIFAIAVVLGACIFIHELGHFAVAKFIGMKVEEFAMGFGRALWSRERGETRYRINLVPLGGYVRIAGMEPGAEPTEGGFYSFARWKGALVLFVGSFMNVVLAALAFIAVILATGLGVFPGNEINVRKVLPNTPAAAADIEPGDRIVDVDGIEHSLLIEDVDPGGPAAEAGLGRYDRIFEVQGEEVALPHELLAAMKEVGESGDEEAAQGDDAEATEDPSPASEAITVEVLGFTDEGEFRGQESVELPIPSDLPDEVARGDAGPVLEDIFGVILTPIGPNEAITYISDRPEQEIDLTLIRDGRRIRTTVTPTREWARVPGEDETGRMTAAHQAVGRVGVVLHGQTRPAGFVEALEHGIDRSVEAVVVTADWMFKMATGEVAPQASGPVGIAAMTADQARIGWTAVASLTGLISANLAIINLLPFPPFDGFRIVLLGIEGIMGRRVNERVEMIVTIAGIAILLAVFLIITFSDILNLVLFQTP